MKHNYLEELTLRAIIPVAGSGNRLRPITLTKPKALVEVAGRPVLDHILQNLSSSTINELVLIIGYKKEILSEWITENYADRFDLHFVTQENRLGLGHAIYCAKNFLDEDSTLILLGDEVFRDSYASMIAESAKNGDIVASIGVKEVDDPSHYGMVEINEHGLVSRMVEKPPQFDGKSSLAGVYFIKKGYLLRDALYQLINKESGGQEYQLTDALQIMVNNGAKIATFDVGEWFDCGRLETILTSNKRLLKNNHHVDASAQIIESDIKMPCYIGPNTTIYKSQIGPNVSIGESVSVRECIIQNSIVESNTVVNESKIVNVVYSSDAILTEEEFESQSRP